MSVWICLLLCTIAALAEDPASGKFLVASRTLGDPNFVETVILLVDYDPKGTVGLIINRSGSIPLREIFTALRGGKANKDMAWEGGPVHRTGAQLLMRSKAPPEGARRIVGDVALSSSGPLLEKMIAEGASSSVFRVYLGYAGWAPGQLEEEMKRGAWHVMRGDASIVFDDDAASVWTRLIRRTELRLAALPPRPAAPARRRNAWTACRASSGSLNVSGISRLTTALPQTSESPAGSYPPNHPTAAPARCGC